MPAPRYLIVGAGFSGAVLARELATRLGAQVVVLEARDHVAGNCHTARDAATGILLHVHGPHIFNTDSERVWRYVQEFGAFGRYLNRVKAHTARGVFPLPINLHTINQFFGRTFNPAEARAFLATLGDPTIGEPRNFEEQALKTIGRELYETFFYGYTRKQWGCEPRELPASILQRLPVRFSYDDTYYARKFQGIPEDGYTAIIERILAHPQIEVRLNTPFARSANVTQASPPVPLRTDSPFDHTFFTGPLDAYFDYAEGRLGYRTVTFERIDAVGDYQGNAVINYPDLAVPWTRIHEHKHFAPWESHERTVAFREYSQETAPGELPYYPKRLAPDKALLARYRAMAEATPGVSFLGRLATYRYMDMETVIGEALAFAEAIASAHARGERPPTFPNRE
jgi:UDP-galactopyranose mutase